MYEEYAKLRNKLGLNDAKVAQIIGVSPSVFTRWKYGKSSPSSKTRLKICEALGIQPTLYFTENNKPPEQFQFSRKKYDQDSLLPVDIELTVGGHKVMIDQKDYADLQRGIDAFISAWLQAKEKSKEK